MIVYITLDENGYVNGWGSTRSSDSDIEIELDDNHEFFKTDFSCWKYENGELIFDEERQQQFINERLQEENKPTYQERLEALENALLELILRSDNDD